MKKLLILFSATLILVGCNTNPDYEKNLATAKKLFELHGEENIDAQLELVSKDIEVNTSMYGSEPFGYEQYVTMLKGYKKLLKILNTQPKIGYPVQMKRVSWMEV